MLCVLYLILIAELSGDDIEGARDMTVNVASVATPARIGHPHREPQDHHVHAAPSAVPVVAPTPPPFDDNGYALDDRWLGRGMTFVRQTPRPRLGECLEQICAALESGFTAECTQQGLLALLWLYTRVKPSVKFTDLRQLGWSLASVLFHVMLAFLLAGN